jgi:hypothetical protein
MTLCSIESLHSISCVNKKILYATDEYQYADIYMHEHLLQCSYTTLIF